jgi:hypothetical protein
MKYTQSRFTVGSPGTKNYADRHDLTFGIKHDRCYTCSDPCAFDPQHYVRDGRGEFWPLCEVCNAYSIPAR